ncbi:MAG: UDP-glucose/GDP-mannose dehydrogenase family protein [Acidobacteria bacterium]|nr:UDP-glucose/GDP-mannose dehydrogenase family protein [Acidobacteriota bacterium]
MNERISVIGLGKLGASMAAAFASRGFEVVGVDVNARAVDLVSQGRAPVQETGLDELIAANHGRIQATLDHENAVLKTDISFVIVPTPSDENGAFSLQYAKWACKEIGRALAKKSGYHNVVLTSTVLPGATRYGLIPVLEYGSGKKAGRDFGVCYSPEFIALGSIIRDFLNPDFTLIGEVDERSGSQLEALYSRVVSNAAGSARMSLENAELTKIAINTFVTTKITFANMLSDLCEQIPGGDVDAVTNALGLDRRIGHRYLTGGTGYGGPCFPRDNVALTYLAQQLGTSAGIAEVTDQINRRMPEQLAKRILAKVRRGATVAVLGLSYKPHTHVTTESHGVYLARELSRHGLRVVGYDPMLPEMDLDELRRDIAVLASLRECLAQAEAVVLATPDAEFDSLTAEDFKNEWASVTVFDLWRRLNVRLSDIPHIQYVPLGNSNDDEANSARLKELWGEPSKDDAAKTTA